MAILKKESEAAVEAEAIKLELSANLVRRQIAKEFKEQEREHIQIPPLYKPYFGKILPIMIQGIEVAIPVDGKAYEVPRVFADRARILMANQDEMIQKGERAANFQNNIESSPGELTLF